MSDEERFTRQKSAPETFYKLVKFCLNQANIELDIPEVSLVHKKYPNDMDNFMLSIPDRHLDTS